jgi:hypothetical protein
MCTNKQVELCFYLFTYTRSWALLEKPPILQPLKNFPAFYGAQSFNTVFTRALHWSLSWAISIQSTPSHHISLRSISIFSTHLRPRNQSGLDDSCCFYVFQFLFFLLHLSKTSPSLSTPLNTQQRRLSRILPVGHLDRWSFRNTSCRWCAARAVSCFAPIGQDGVPTPTRLLFSPKYKHTYIYKQNPVSLHIHFYLKDRGSIYLRNADIIASIHML